MHPGQHGTLIELGTHVIVAGFASADATDMERYALGIPSDPPVLPSSLSIATTIGPDPTNWLIPSFITPNTGHFTLGVANDDVIALVHESDIVMVRRAKPRGGVALWIVAPIDQATYTHHTQGRNVPREVQGSLPYLSAVNRTLVGALAPHASAVASVLRTTGHTPCVTASP